MKFSFRIFLAKFLQIYSGAKWKEVLGDKETLLFLNNARNWKPRKMIDKNKSIEFSENCRQDEKSQIAEKRDAKN